MGVYKALTDYLPNFENDSRGTWAVDPSDGYCTAKGSQFIGDVYSFMDEHPEYELNKYHEILKENGLEWGMDSLKRADVSALNGKCVMALMMGAVRADKFATGALFSIFESGAIERWLLRLKEIDKGEGTRGKPSKADEIKDKVFGAMFGFAIGDAMGATTEFMDAKEIKAKYGKVENIIGGGWLNLKAGAVTDDTEMMLCVVKAAMDSEQDVRLFPKCVADRFIEWYRGGPKDVGGACAAGIRRLMAGQGPELNRNTLGNGALMRALPLALMDRLNDQLIQADMTHCNPTQHQLITAYHNMVVRQVYGSKYGGDIEDIEWRSNGKKIDLEEPTGHIANTLHHALRAILDNGNFHDTIVQCVNGGGDADTIAAIAGGLAGAKYGWNAIPKEWISQLNSDIRHQLEEASEFIVSQCLIRHNNSGE